MFPGGAGWEVPLRRLLRDVGAPPRKFVMDTTIRRLITLNSQLSPPARASSSCWRGALGHADMGPAPGGIRVHTLPVFQTSRGAWPMRGGCEVATGRPPSTSAQPRMAAMLT